MRLLAAGLIGFVFLSALSVGADATPPFYCKKHLQFPYGIGVKCPSCSASDTNPGPTQNVCTYVVECIDANVARKTYVDNRSSFGFDLPTKVWSERMKVRAEMNAALDRIDEDYKKAKMGTKSRTDLREKRDKMNDELARFDNETADILFSDPAQGERAVDRLKDIAGPWTEGIYACRATGARAGGDLTCPSLEDCAKDESVQNIVGQETFDPNARDDRVRRLEKSRATGIGR